MIRVLIVDDEALVRMGIRMGIDWEGNGFALIGEASNGAEALEICRRERPDIVVTDVKMPEMDGIGLIEAVRTFAPEIVFVVLSGYDDYQYVRSAMKLGAYDYLLKLSLDPDGLLEILCKIRDWQTRQNNAVQSAGQNKRNTLEDILHGNASLCEWEDRPMCMMVLALDNIPQMEKRLERKSKPRHMEALEAVVMQTVEGEACLVSRLETYEWALLLSAPQPKTYARQLAVSISDMLEVCFEQKASFGISDPFTGASDCQNALRQARDAVMQRYLSGGGQCCDFAQKPVLPLLFSWKDEEELFTAVLCADIDIMTTVIERVVGALAKSEAPMEARAVMREMLLVQLRGAKISGLDARVFCQGEQPIAFMDGCETLTQAKERLLHVAERLCVALRKRLQSHRPGAVEEALQFIRDNIGDKLSLRQISRHVNMSEAYFSKLFSRTMNMKLTEYIARQKVERAIVLLVSTDWKIYRIAKEVGFDDERYFSRVFKRYTDKSPNAFRHYE